MKSEVGSKRSLRTVVSAVVFFLIVALVGGLYVLANSVLTERFALLEKREAALNVERVRNAVDEQYAYLLSKVQDWAYWDDAYTFVQDGNEAFRESNLTDNALPNLGLHLLIYTNEKKEIVAGLQYDLDQGKPVPLSKGVDQIVNATSPFLNFKDEMDSHSGLVELPEGVMIVVSKSVITSEQKGPIKGALLFGQFFDKALVEKLSKVTRLNLKHELTSTLTEDFAEQRPFLESKGAIQLKAASDDIIRGYTSFLNLDAKPVVIVRADMPRELMTQGKSTITYFITALSIIGIIFGFVVVFTLEKTVVSRLVALARSVTDIARTNAAGNRVPAGGRDELTDVSTAINQMLETIELRNRTLKDIMDNVEFGFFICTSDLVIQGGFTKSCVNLFNRDKISGMDLGAVLGLDSQKYEWYKTVYEQVYQDVFPEETSLGQLPDRFKVNDKTLQLKGRALRNEQGQIRAILFSVTDITALERAEIENLEHRTLIKILKSPQAFADFIGDVRSGVNLMETLYEKGDQVGIRRILHTLKGNFGCFDLVAISRMIHAIEEESSVTLGQIQSVRQSTKDFLKKYDEVLRMDFDGSSKINFTIPETEISDLETLLSTNSRVTHGEILARVRALRLKPIKELMGPIADMVGQAAERLGKNVALELNGEEIKVDGDRIKPIIEVLPHLLKNAIDHGIEPDYARGSKPERARLSIGFSSQGPLLTITIADDGRGLDVLAIENKARQKGLLKQNENPSVDQLIQFIFLDNFSTAESVSEISGRGVGMAAVRSAVDQCQGTISVHSQTGEGCTFTIRIPNGDLKSVESPVSTQHKAA